MAFYPEHPKWDQNPKFAPLSETTSIPAPFIWESPETLLSFVGVFALLLPFVHSRELSSPIPRSCPPTSTPARYRLLMHPLVSYAYINPTVLSLIS